jgi:hypothetical protein
MGESMGLRLGGSRLVRANGQLQNRGGFCHAVLPQDTPRPDDAGSS